MQANHTIEGLWEWVEMDFKGCTDWMTVGIFAAGEFIWRFFPEGILVARHGQRITRLAKYLYDPVRKFLEITGLQLEAEGKFYAVMHEFYQVEMIDPNKLILRKIQNDGTPEETVYRMQFRKIAGTDTK